VGNQVEYFHKVKPPHSYSKMNKQRPQGDVNQILLDEFEKFMDIFGLLQIPA